MIEIYLLKLLKLIKFVIIFKESNYKRQKDPSLQTGYCGTKACKYGFEPTSIQACVFDFPSIRVNLFIIESFLGVLAGDFIHPILYFAEIGMVPA